MNAQQQLYDLLINETNITDHVGDRIYPLTFQKNGTFPVIVYELVDTDFHNMLINDNLTDSEAYLVLNIVGKDYGSVQLITNEVIEVLKTNRYVINNTHDYHEDLLDLFGRQLSIQTHSTLA